MSIERKLHPIEGAAPDEPTNIDAFAIAPTTEEDKLNKTERAWLEVLRNRNYDELGVQCITLKLGDDCRYTPDFHTIAGGIFIFWEVKGFMRDDALVKIKAAARRFRWARFIKVERIKGEWVETKIKP